MIWINVIQAGVNLTQIDVIQNCRIFVPNRFKFNIIFTLSIFENDVASTIFTFTFRCAITWLTPVGEILRPSDRVRYVKACPSGSGNLWAYVSDGYQWVHTNAIISVPIENKYSFCYNYSDSQRRFPNHHIHLYQWRCLIGYYEWVCHLNAL